MHELHSGEKPLNIVKLIAEDHLASVMRKLGIEDNKENRDDILALALNSMPAKYVTSDEGKQYAQLVNGYRNQHETDILSHLTKAGIIVMASPRKREKDKGAES